MKRMSLKQATIATVALSAAMLAASAQAAGYYYRQSTVLVDLPFGQTDVVILSATVPAGTWVIHTMAIPVNPSTKDIQRCRIWVDGAPRAFSSTELGEQDMLPLTAVITNYAVVTLGSAQAVELKCGHDGSAPGQRIDPGAQMTITRAPAS